MCSYLEGHRSSVSANESTWAATGNLSHEENLDYTTFDSDALNVFILVVYAVISVLGLVCNTVIIAVMPLCVKMRSVNDVLIWNLAVTDGMLLLAVPVHLVEVLLSGWPFGQVFCKIQLSVSYLNHFGSSLTLVVMSLDRCLVVKQRFLLKCHRRSVLGWKLCCLIWILALPLAAPVGIMATARPAPPVSSAVCLLVFPDPEWWWAALWKWSTCVMAYILPACIMVTCYSVLLQALHAAGRKFPIRRKAVGCATRRVVYLVGAFMVCWTPFYMFMVIDLTIHLQPSYRVETARRFFIILGTLNSFINPVLHGFLNERVCSHLKLPLCV